MKQNKNSSSTKHWLRMCEMWWQSKQVKVKSTLTGSQCQSELRIIGYAQFEAVQGPCDKTCVSPEWCKKHSKNWKFNLELISQNQENKQSECFMQVLSQTEEVWVKTHKKYNLCNAQCDLQGYLLLWRRHDSATTAAPSTFLVPSLLLIQT